MGLRIERLDFKPWGCFEDHSLHFSPTAGHVDLIEGPNATGKSTTSRGESALLYGIPGQTADAHSYEYADLRVGARLIIDGEALEIVRRKARVGGLLTPEGATLSSDPLPAALGGMTKDVYTSFFQVNHGTLVRGGEELLAGKGDVGASLFAAAAGIGQLHDTLGAFDERASAIFRSRATTTKLARELAVLREAEKRLKQAILKPSTHHRMEKELQAAQESCERLSGEIREIEAGIREIQRQLAAAPLLDEHTTILAKLAERGEVVKLAPDARGRRVAAQAARRAGSVQLARLTDERRNLQGRHDAIEIDYELLLHAVEIRAVQEEMPVITKAAVDRRKLEGLLGEAERKLAVVAADIGVEPDELIGLRRSGTALRALDATIREHGDISERLRGAKTRTEAAERRNTADIEALKGATAVGGDTSALGAAVRVARQKLGLLDQLASERVREETARQLAQQALARLRPAPADLAALSALPVPSAEVVAALVACSDRQLAAEQELAADRLRWKASGRDLQERRERLRHEGEVLTAADLAAARRERDEQWAQLRSVVDTGAPVATGLPDRFELTVASADRAADSLAADAAAAERAASIAADQIKHDAEKIAMEERTAEIATQRSTVDREWAEAWAITGLAPIELPAVHGWLRDRDAIVEGLDQADAALVAVAALEKQITGLTSSLRKHLADVSIGIDDGTTLTETVELAEAHLTEQLESAARAAALRTAAESSSQELDDATRARSAVETEWAAWLEAWPACRDAGGLPAHAQPGLAQELLRSIAEGLANAEKIEEIAGRIKGIDRDNDALAERVGTLAGVLAPELADVDMVRVAATLAERLREHEAARERRDVMAERIAAVGDEIAILMADIETADAEIKALCADAGVDTAEELATVEDRAEEAASLQAELNALEQRIAETGQGTFAEVAASVAELDRDGAESKMAQLAETISDLSAQRDETKEEIGTQKAALQECEGDVSAVIAAEDVEFSQARIHQLAKECAVARLSAAVLRRAIERYRSLHQDPLMMRANALFSRFTQGHYAELFVDTNDRGEPVILARRRDRALHDMEAMSDGTREQLFLALRIAAIERYVEMSGAVPVIFDDVFLESDESRSGKIFEALGELALRTQVIVLTHHHHLVSVGRNALGEALRVQELPAPTVALRAAA